MDYWYTDLRDVVVRLTSPADAQCAYLDRLFANMSGGWSPSSYGNDELALEFEDSFVAVDYMLDHGKILPSQIEALSSLDQLLGAMSGEENKDVWKRQALF